MILADVQDLQKKREFGTEDCNGPKVSNKKSCLFLDKCNFPFMFTDICFITTNEYIECSPIQGYELSRAALRQLFGILAGNSVSKWLFVVVLGSSIILNCFKVDWPAEEGGFQLGFSSMI
jgi:hypothetical protein